jgi:hypothetical protein
MNSIQVRKEIKARDLISRGKYLIRFLSCLVILSGCSRYQYVSINSHLDQNDKKEFVNENDTISIKYSFAGENFPLTITLYNKLRQPVYIDLQRSTVVINNVQVNSPFYRDNQISFIAPLSYATLNSNPLKDQFIELNPQDSLIDQHRNNLGINYSFNEETTSLYFRVILALTTDENYSNPTFFDYSFWVSDVLQSVNGPKSVSYKPSNMFYIKKSTNFGKSVFWIGLILILIISSGLSAGG